MNQSLLIEKVKEHEVLYNNRSLEYRDQHVRQAAWDEIGRKLRISGDEAKECWEKLRRCLCNARNRRRNDIKNSLTVETKAFWKYEQQMSFIVPFLKDGKSHNKLKSQASVDFVTEAENQSEESEAKESCQSEEGHIDTESEQYAENSQTADYEAEKKRKHLRNKKQKEPIDNAAHQMVQTLKKSTTLRKHQYKEKNMRPKQSKTGFLENLDDTDMFFLSMSRMTKQLPKVKQAQIKLALSNSVLSAEVKKNKNKSESVFYN